MPADRLLDKLRSQTRAHVAPDKLSRWCGQIAGRGVRCEKDLVDRTVAAARRAQTPVACAGSPAPPSARPALNPTNTHYNVTLLDPSKVAANESFLREYND
jgi:hypothetical protein